jgi:glycerol-1-phosphate dehydrogenase [NAD(P)+]
MEQFKKIKEMIFPRNVLVGHNASEQIANLCNRIVYGNALVVEDKITKKILGNKIAKLLKEGGYQVAQVEISAATLKEVKKVESSCKKNNSDFLVGVGGGTVIDVTKMAAYNLSKPFISVPTAASHDGIASPRASLKNKKGSVSKPAVAPIAVVADTSVIIKAPYRMLASGCADVISNISAVKDWQLAHRLKNEEYSSYAAALSETAANTIIENADYIKPGEEEAAWIAAKTTIVSGVAMSVAGNSRPTSGAEHMFSHMLDKIAPGKALHGEQCGVGTIMMMYLHGEDWKMIRDVLKKIGAPTNAKELGIPKKKIIEALIHAQEIRPERYTILGEKGLTEEAAIKVAKITEVI